MYFVSCNSTEFIYSNSVLVDLLGFPIHVMCDILSPANSDSFTYFFPILLPFISFSCVTDPTGTRNNSDSFTSFFPILLLFISFSCVTDPTGTGNTLFSKSNKSGHPCFLSDLREKVFTFCY